MIFRLLWKGDFLGANILISRAININEKPSTFSRLSHARLLRLIRGWPHFEPPWATRRADRFLFVHVSSGVRRNISRQIGDPIHEKTFPMSMFAINRLEIIILRNIHNSYFDLWRKIIEKRIMYLFCNYLLLYSNLIIFYIKFVFYIITQLLKM